MIPNSNKNSISNTKVSNKNASKKDETTNSTYDMMVLTLNPCKFFVFTNSRDNFPLRSFFLTITESGPNPFLLAKIFISQLSWIFTKNSPFKFVLVWTITLPPIVEIYIKTPLRSFVFEQTVPWIKKLWFGFLNIVSMW